VSDGAVGYGVAIDGIYLWARPRLHRCLLRPTGYDTTDLGLHMHFVVEKDDIYQIWRVEFKYKVNWR